MNRALPVDLKVVLETALEKDRERRYATALDFAEDLRRVRCFEPIAAKPAGPLTKLYRWTQRNPSLAAALIGLFVVLAAGLVVALVLLSQKDEALSRETTERKAKVSALEQVTAERNDKQTALNEKATALTNYDRLGDVSRHARLMAEAESLWPAEPEQIAALQAWIKDAEKLQSNLTGHVQVRDALRRSPAVLPYSDEDRALDAVRLQPVSERRAAATKERADAAALTAESQTASGSTASRPEPRPESQVPTRAASRPTLEDLRAAVARVDAELSTLDARLQERLTWRFKDEAAQFQHDTTAKLVADLQQFVAPDPYTGALASVRKRLRFAETVEAESRTRADRAEAWADAVASIANRADCPKYDGFRIKPQLGLIPIGKDPQSGLWEFADLATTAEGVDPVPTHGKDGRLIIKETTGLIFVLLPGGTFQMGARRPTLEEAEDAADGEPLPPNVDPAADNDEGPVHAVTLAPFFLSKYELTQRQWQRLVGRNPSGYGPGWQFGGKATDLRHPVEQVSWEDCDRWLGRLGLLLPTEAQWEYGSRAGTTTPWWTGAQKETLVAGANVADAYGKANSGPRNWSFEAWSDGYTVHAPVGSFAANAFGLHDTLGNVWEWCRDGNVRYSPTNWRQVDGLRDAGPSPRIRVFRGGSFDTDASQARSTYRPLGTPAARSNILGVRPSRRVSAP